MNPTTVQICRAVKVLLPPPGSPMKTKMVRRVLGALVGAPALVAAQASDRTRAAHYFALREPVIDRMHEAIVGVLERAQRETLRKLRAHFAATVKPLVNAESDGAGGVGIDMLFDLGKFRDRLLATVRTQSAAALQTAGDQANEELAGEGFDDLDPFHMPNPDALRFLDERANFLKDTADSVHAQIKQTIADGMQAGQSYAQIARALRGQFHELADGRAMTVASTETGAAYGAARHHAFRRAGVEYKAWLTSHLPNTREWHAEAEETNVRVPLEEPFLVANAAGKRERLMHPGDGSLGASPDNVINCHCISVVARSNP